MLFATVGDVPAGAVAAACAVRGGGRYGDGGDTGL
jgi:hypothetical protein